MMNPLHRIVTCSAGLLLAAGCYAPATSQSVDPALGVHPQLTETSLADDPVQQVRALPCSASVPVAIPQEWHVAADGDADFLPSIHAEALLRQRLQGPGQSWDQLPIVTYLASCPTSIAGEWWVLLEYRLPLETRYQTLLVAVPRDGTRLRILGRPWMGADSQQPVLAQLQNRK